MVAVRTPPALPSARTRGSHPASAQAQAQAQFNQRATRAGRPSAVAPAVGAIPACPGFKFGPRIPGFMPRTCGWSLDRPQGLDQTHEVETRSARKAAGPFSGGDPWELPC